VNGGERCGGKNDQTLAIDPETVAYPSDAAPRLKVALFTAGT
jgi:hypothetical protein